MLVTSWSAVYFPLRCLLAVNYKHINKSRKYAGFSLRIATSYNNIVFWVPHLDATLAGRSGQHPEFEQMYSSVMV
jgi:hypothetical protein